MFGKKKDGAPVAKRLITEALADLESAASGDFYEPYISGLIDMAYELGAIGMNERTDLKAEAHTKAQAQKAKGQPVYKNKGVYEYNGYNIFKDFDKEAGAGSACWYVKKIGADKIIAADLTFKEAAKVIDNESAK